MKKILLASLLWLCTWGAIAQVGMGTIDPKAALDIMSSEAGILIPRMSTSVRESITVGADQNAMLVYDTDTQSFWFYEHSTTAWKELQINDGSGIETLTSLVDNGDGTWTYTDEEGTDTVLNLAAQEPWFGTDDNMGATDNTEDIYTMGRVGIGVDTPAATLEVAGEAGTATVLDGIIPPRLTGDELRAKTYTAAQTGAMVYVTAGDTAPSGQTVNVTTAGTYTFDGTVWKHIENGFKNNRHTMVQGWPDAIRCNVTSPDWGETTFYQIFTPYNDGLYVYRFPHPHGGYDLFFNSDGTFSSESVTSDCSSKSISELYDEGKAFNFVGGETVRDPDPATNLTSAIAGDIVYDTTDDELQVFNGTTWESIWATGETLTTLALNADGEHLDYTDEEGTVTQINLAATTLATQQVFHAEYAGGTLEADGTDNSITINASNSGAPTFMNYYEASNFETDGGTNDYNVVLRFTLPEDFESWNANAIVIDYEGTADASFEADVYAEGNATALQDNSAVNGTGLGSFAAHTISADTAVNTLVAGATAIILIKLTVTDAATTDTSIIRIGDITLNYNKRRF